MIFLLETLSPDLNFIFLFKSIQITFQFHSKVFTFRSHSDYLQVTFGSDSLNTKIRFDHIHSDIIRYIHTFIVYNKCKVYYKVLSIQVVYIEPEDIRKNFKMKTVLKFVEELEKDPKDDNCKRLTKSQICKKIRNFWFKFETKYERFRYEKLL
jgi:hypothetical protein